MQGKTLVNMLIDLHEQESFSKISSAILIVLQKNEKTPHFLRSLRQNDTEGSDEA